MVISDKNRYLFVELYFTGSTAISSELCEYYDGQKILSKHSRYHEFLNVATPEQKEYFVLSCIRNPMDMVVSTYMKFKTNHLGKYTNPKDWRRNGGIITDKNLKLYNEIKDLTFEEYFKKYHKVPYDNWSNVAHSKFDYLIRFENIQEDFSKALKLLNIDQVRELPQKNKTLEKKSFIDYYTPEIRQQAIFIFGPFMKKWGYEFPKEWHVKEPGVLSNIMFYGLGFFKKTYWQFTKTKSVPG
ncbi:MAG TPA: sulfotransferase family 2 domain-containing protein [Parafilimonas sp.]|nr:sulfotransferase family 2 domain-containing protein [Parafilimonas sp.]